MLITGVDDCTATTALGITTGVTPTIRGHEAGRLNHVTSSRAMSQYERKHHKSRMQAMMLFGPHLRPLPRKLLALEAPATIDGSTARPIMRGTDSWHCRRGYLHCRC
ncbi:hypothetical protein LIA77_04739 [Sarocladium implicatum]|nr:hypothetical protein LIA77_04739 [Sarocladium implicatum]